MSVVERCNFIFHPGYVRKPQYIPIHTNAMVHKNDCATRPYVPEDLDMMYNVDKAGCGLCFRDLD